jgi:hypothetical protein
VFHERVDLAISNVSLEPALFITSRRINAKTANAVTWAHWSIETYQHILDVSYGEDTSRLANENTAQNLGVVRRLVQNLLSAVEPRRSFSINDAIAVATPNSGYMSSIGGLSDFATALGISRSCSNALDFLCIV